MTVGGTSAISREAMDATMHDALRVAPLVLIVLLLVLALYLRALVAPLYLLGASVLGVACALGVSGWMFGVLVHTGGVSYLVPITAAILLLALGSDYNIFLAGRVWQEARRRPLDDATALASARASRPISLAGTVLALSFALLVIVPVGSFRALAFAMTAGLLIDAFIVRTLLVPALISLIGPASAWPGNRGRRASQAHQQVPNGGGSGQERVVAGVEFDDARGPAGEVALQLGGVPRSWAQTR